ncbi:uncharacterized protein [Oscarella lobularis]|uniref:uncharacterized protein n=1 Tax=Oscarella lobularis TaxID=121494 RepID=UPI00331408FA
MRPDALSWIPRSLNFVFASGTVVVALFEFFSLPPFFDLVNDQSLLNYTAFENDPRKDKGQIRRFMDAPILANAVFYFLLCVWLRFRSYSYVLSIFIVLIYFFFFLVHFIADETFNWKYSNSRLRGVYFQTAAVAASLVANIIVLRLRKGGKMVFNFKTPLPKAKRSSDEEEMKVIIPPNHWLSILWNFVALFIPVFLCLIVWFFRMYMSFACFSSSSDILIFCEVSQQVQCYPCGSCTTSGINSCSMTNRSSIFHCLSPMADINADKGAICLFNYNVGWFTFLLVFAFIGGLFFFLLTFMKGITNWVLLGGYRLYVSCLRRHHAWKTSRRRNTPLHPSVNLIQEEA